MDQISADMDAAAGDYRDGDGRSWWVTHGDGARRLVRMQGFDAKSPTTAELLDDPVFVRIGTLTGDGHHNRGGMVGNRVEALFKPIGVAQGISDVPWHKDCSLGRHSYDCSNLTTGISVTGATEDSGQLRVRRGLAPRAVLARAPAARARSPRPAAADREGRHHGAPLVHAAHGAAARRARAAVSTRASGCRRSLGGRRTRAPEAARGARGRAVTVSQEPSRAAIEANVARKCDVRLTNNLSLA